MDWLKGLGKSEAGFFRLKASILFTGFIKHKSRKMITVVENDSARDFRSIPAFVYGGNQCGKKIHLSVADAKIGALFSHLMLF